MKVFLNTFVVCLVLVVESASAEPSWTGGGTEGANAHTISVVDSLHSNNSIYVTLSGFTDNRCSANSNRIHVTSSNQEHFNKLVSIVLSAYHSGSGISFLIDDNCVADRAIVLK